MPETDPDDSRLAQVTSALTSLRGRPQAEVRDVRLLSGGATRETWSAVVVTAGVPEAVVLQARRPRDLPDPLDVPAEAALLRALAAHGVPVPRVVAEHDSGALGAPFLVTAAVEGETLPQRVLRQPAYAAAGPAVAHGYADALAATQRVPLDQLPALPEQDALSTHEELLSGFAPRPVLEVALRWLQLHRPAPGPPVLVHGDFRNGNAIVGPEGLRAVIDWEAAHVGDPLEDLAWFCLRPWRFGAQPKAGGLLDLEPFLHRYTVAGGPPVDQRDLLWWRVLGCLRWAVICLSHASTHLSGRHPSLELAVAGRRVTEAEFDLLLLLPRARV